MNKIRNLLLVLGDQLTLKLSNLASGDFTSMIN
jgi:hypothetical protein